MLSESTADAQFLTEGSSALDAALARSSSRHQRLCPRQVLGVRIGLVGAASLGIAVPSQDHRLFLFVETDGCFTDGIEAATGCSLGHRTLRLEDYGRIAATFVDIKAESAVRVAPVPGVRARATGFEPDEPRRYYAQLGAYQRMSDAELFVVTPIKLGHDMARVIGRNGVRVDCSSCGEEVVNQRERTLGGQPICIACSGNAYYRELSVGSK